MENFLGEIRMMSFPRAPRGWAYCQGQTLPINQNQALFSLLGTQFGGDGVTTFKLPDLRGRVAVGQGRAPSGTNYSMGQLAGTENVALTTEQIPAHAHTFTGTLKVSGDADSSVADNTYPATTVSDPPAKPATPYATGTPNATMGAALQNPMASAGGSQPHENRQPFMAMNYAIALTGIFPSRG